MDCSTRKLKRILLLLSMLQGGAQGTARSFATALSVSLRTVHRYIAALKKCDVLVGYDAERMEYYIFGREQVKYGITWLEAGALLSVVNNSAFSRSVLASAMEAVHKLTGSLSESDRNLARQFSETCRVGGDYDNVTQSASQMTMTLQQAAFQKRAVRLKIRGIRGTTLFKPYAVALWNAQWVAVGRSSEHRKTIVVPVADVEAGVVTEDRVVVPVRFDVEKELRCYQIRSDSRRKAS